MVIRINMNRQLLREWYKTGQVTSFPITNPSSDASEVVVAKRTKTTCKSCDKAAIAGNYGFCDEHRVRVARAGASNNEAQPVIINLVDENPGSANLTPGLVDLLEPSSELFPPGAGSVHEPVPTAAQQQHLSQRGEVRVYGLTESEVHPPP